MGIFSSIWNKITDEERKEFLDAFEEDIVGAYLRRDMEQHLPIRNFRYQVADSSQAVRYLRVNGVPVSDAARWRVQSWSPEDFDVTEWACRPHAWDYSLEGPLSALRIWADIDQATQRVIAYHGHLNQQEQETTIWMDGRPHPPANAIHTWSGFSTGEWDGRNFLLTLSCTRSASSTLSWSPRSSTIRDSSASARFFSWGT